ncbi:hypothetical protein BDZ85DRAFT_260356 [Elsinoe ampelina]|uniref:Uncharacterized protein n=1 Tax=Elsinoe ampelina TaxID=302913 RepID=A0A6A6GF84_9PEZI|nr:hypothetical protein BDZ85DRAFT_260356 [Elsinoe ampelina]
MSQIPGLSLGIPGLSFQPSVPSATLHSDATTRQSDSAFYVAPQPVSQTFHNDEAARQSNASAFAYNRQSSLQLPQDQFLQTSQSEREDGELSDISMSRSSSGPSATSGLKRKASDDLSGPPAVRQHTGESGATFQLSVRGAAQLKNHEKRSLLILSALLRESRDPDALLSRLTQITHQIRDQVMGAPEPSQAVAASESSPAQHKPNSAVIPQIDRKTSSGVPATTLSSQKQNVPKSVPQDRNAYLARLQELKTKKATASTPPAPAIKKQLPTINKANVPAPTPPAKIPSTNAATATTPKFTPRPDMNTILAKKLAALRAERAEKLAAEKAASDKLSAEIDQLIESAPRSANDSKPTTPSATTPALATPPLPNRSARNRPTAADLNESDDLYGGTASDSNRPSPDWHQSVGSEHYDSVVIEASSSEDEDDEAQVRNVADMERDIEKIKAEIKAREERKRQAAPSASPMTQGEEVLQSRRPQSQPEKQSPPKALDRNGVAATATTNGKGVEQSVAVIETNAEVDMPMNKENDVLVGDQIESSSHDSSMDSDQVANEAGQEIEQEIEQDSDSADGASGHKHDASGGNVVLSSNSSSFEEDDDDDMSMDISESPVEEKQEYEMKSADREGSVEQSTSEDEESESDDSDAMDMSSEDASSQVASDSRAVHEDTTGGDNLTKGVASSSSSGEVEEEPESTKEELQAGSASMEEASDDDEYEPEPFVERDPSLSPLGSGSPPPAWQRPEAAFPISNNVIIHNESGSSDIPPSRSQPETRSTPTRAFVPYQPLRRAGDYKLN